MAKIDDQDEIQFRQVNPCWMEDDDPSRQAFIPTKKDKGKLSFDRSATTTAKASLEDFKLLGLNSDGVYGLTPQEMSEEPFPIECFESPLVNNPHHSYAEFEGLSNSQKKRKSQELRRKALARGKLYP
jgi:hypothetical protein